MGRADGVRAAGTVKRVKRAWARAVLHGADALMMRLDRMLGTNPRDLLWVPEARVDDVERWEA